MEDRDLEKLKELLPQSDGLEAYYDACVTILRTTFLRVTKAVKDIQLPERPSQSSEADAQGTHHPMPKRPRHPPRPVRPQPPVPPWAWEGVGFHLVDVVRLGQFALIGFQWQETGEQIYVYIVDLQKLANEGWAVGMVDTVVLTNLLERVRPHWHLHHQMPRIHGLTFME